MHFVKLILFAIAIEFMCCLGVIEKEERESQTSVVKVETIDPVHENDQKSIQEGTKPIPIKISIQ